MKKPLKGEFQYQLNRLSPFESTFRLLLATLYKHRYTLKKRQRRMDENKNKIKCLFILEILAIPFLLFTLFCVISRARGLCRVQYYEQRKKGNRFRWGLMFILLQQLNSLTDSDLKLLVYYLMSMQVPLAMSSSLYDVLLYTG